MGTSSKDRPIIQSTAGDGNSLTSKFGIGRNLSNRFDQRVGDGLTDLLSGAIGVRTSNIHDISQKVKDANKRAYEERTLALNQSAERKGAAAVPKKQTVLVFPEHFFNEKGRSTGYNANLLDENCFKPGSEEQAGAKAQNLKESYKAQTMAFPNSIHFRSLPRPKVDTTLGWWSNETEETKSKANDPANEEVFDIFLYLPHDLGDGIKVTYESAEGGMVDTFFARLFTGGDGTTDDLMGNRGFDMSEVMKMFQGMLPGGAIIQRAAGAISNPMKFQSFTGLEFRSYTYKFTLKPSSTLEAQTIRHIIHAFKVSMLPGTAGNNDRIWTMPNEWLIKFQGPIKRWIDFPLTVALESCDVNYAAGGGYALMEDGSPQAIELTLTFKETTQMSRQKYERQVSAYSAAGGNRIAADRTTQLSPDIYGPVAEYLTDGSNEQGFVGPPEPPEKSQEQIDKEFYIIQRMQHSDSLLRSDTALKDNITLLGQYQGHNIYSWTWNNIAQSLGITDPEIGVTAQEVAHIPNVVSTHESGYLQVDYGILFGNKE
jgi:hypothetical protein